MEKSDPSIHCSECGKVGAILTAWKVGEAIFAQWRCPDLHIYHSIGEWNGERYDYRLCGADELQGMVAHGETNSYW